MWNNFYQVDLAHKPTKGPAAPGGVGPGPVRVNAYPDPRNRVGAATLGPVAVTGRRPHQTGLWPSLTNDIHNFLSVRAFRVLRGPVHPRGFQRCDALPRLREIVATGVRDGGNNDQQRAASTSVRVTITFPACRICCWISHFMLAMNASVRCSRLFRECLLAPRGVANLRCRPFFRVFVFLNLCFRVCGKEACCGFPPHVATLRDSQCSRRLLP